MERGARIVEWGMCAWDRGMVILEDVLDWGEVLRVNQFG